MPILGVSLIFLMGIGTSVSVYADTIQVNGINNYLMEPVNIEFNGAKKDIYVGALKGTFDGKNTYFFCYDLNHTITVPGTFTATVLNPGSSSFPSNLLLPSSFNIQVATSMLNTTNLSTFTNVNQFAGMELAIWTVLYDWSKGVTPNLNTGTCTTGFCAPGVSSALITDANMYLATARSFAASFPNGQSLGNWQLLSSVTGTHTNQVLIGLGVGVPEPHDYILLGSMLCLTLFTVGFKKHSSKIA
jgi:hypothetical protein